MYVYIRVLGEIIISIPNLNRKENQMLLGGLVKNMQKVLVCK